MNNTYIAVWSSFEDQAAVSAFGGGEKNENTAPEEMTESYKLLPPEGNVFGYGKWTFSDEQGNETNYLSFDVFMGRSAKSRNVDLTPDVAYLYKDLSEYYKNKYPQAGVKTVVVSYAVSIK